MPPLLPEAHPFRETTVCINDIMFAAISILLLKVLQKQTETYSIYFLRIMKSQDVEMELFF